MMRMPVVFAAGDSSCSRFLASDLGQVSLIFYVLTNALHLNIVLSKDGNLIVAL